MNPLNNDLKSPHALELSTANQEAASLLPCPQGDLPKSTLNYIQLTEVLHFSLPAC